VSTATGTGECDLKQAAGTDRAPASDMCAVGLVVVTPGTAVPLGILGV
jgi:hypothetical protein